MGGSSTGANDYSASDLLASITKQQWGNYQALYKPIEDQQIAYATNQQVPVNAALQAGATSNQAFQAQAQGLQKTLQGQGVTLNPQQQAALGRKTNLAAGLGEVNAMNHAATSAYDTQTGVLTGTPGSTNIGAPGQLSQGL